MPMLTTRTKLTMTTTANVANDDDDDNEDDDRGDGDATTTALTTVTMTTTTVFRLDVTKPMRELQYWLLLLLPLRRMVSRDAEALQRVRMWSAKFYR